MKVRSLILFLLLFITAALPLRAQWSGSADLSAGLGGMTGNDELGVGLLGHLLTKGDAGAQIQKKFKDFTLYFDGRDLLDNARRTTFESADGQECWVDVARENRRLFLLGIRWNF